MFLLACECGGSPPDAAPAPASVSPVPPFVVPVYPPAPTAYDAIRAMAQAWTSGCEKEVPVSKNAGCTATEQAAISAVRASSGKVYFEQAFFNAEAGTPAHDSLGWVAGPRKVKFTGNGDVVFGGSKFAAGGAVCDPECCDAGGTNCEPFDQGCRLGLHKVGNCTSDPGSWTDGPFEITRTVTYQPESATNDDDRGEVLFSADSLSIVCRTVQTPFGSMRDTEFRVLGTVKGVRLQTGHGTYDGFVPAYTVIDEVLGGSPPSTAVAPAAVAVPGATTATATSPPVSAPAESSTPSTPASSGSAAASTTTKAAASKPPASRPVRARPPRR